jgi:hypothetical protein
VYALDDNQTYSGDVPSRKVRTFRRNGSTEVLEKERRAEEKLRTNPGSRKRQRDVSN